MKQMRLPLVVTAMLAIALSLPVAAAAAKIPTPCDHAPNAKGKAHRTCLVKWKRQVRARARQAQINPFIAEKREMAAWLMYNRSGQIAEVIDPSDLGPVFFTPGTVTLRIGVVGNVDDARETLEDRIDQLFPRESEQDLVKARLRVFAARWTHAAILQTYTDIGQRLAAAPALRDAITLYGVKLDMAAQVEMVHVAVARAASEDTYLQVQAYMTQYGEHVLVRRATDQESVPLQTLEGHGPHEGR